MYICICACLIYKRLCAYEFVHACVYESVNRHVCECVCRPVSMYVHVCACTRLCTCVYPRMHQTVSV